MWWGVGVSVALERESASSALKLTAWQVTEHDGRLVAKRLVACVRPRFLIRRFAGVGKVSRLVSKRVAFALTAGALTRTVTPVSYTHLRAHETDSYLV